MGKTYKLTLYETWTKIREVEVQAPNREVAETMVAAREFVEDDTHVLEETLHEQEVEAQDFGEHPLV